jgi:UDP-glucose-4-epimerase GalE
MRILIAGGAGYIGSHAVRLFVERGHEVTVYDNLCRGHAEAVRGGKLVQGDLLDTAHLERTLRAEKIEAVVNFAALTYVGESVKQPADYYRANLVGSLSLLEAMRRCDIKHLVVSSTAAVYGVPEKSPITEDQRLAPINPYGRSKLAVEWALADFAAAYGLGYAALRYFNAAGAGPAGDLGEDHTPETHLIPLILQTALGQRSHIEMFGEDYPTSDGTCIRDYVHVNDLAEAHLLALEKIQPGQGKAYNLGTGRGYSVKELIDACREVTGRSIEVRVGPRREGDPPALVASPERAMRELGWRPRFTELHELIETAWRWHSSHPRGYAT